MKPFPEIAGKGRVAAAGAAGQVPRRERRAEDVFSVADDGFGIVGDQDFLRAPFAEQEGGFFTVVGPGQDFGFGGVGLQIADERQIFLLFRPVTQFQRSVFIAAAEDGLHVERRIAESGAGFGVDTNRVTIIGRDAEKDLGLLSKEETARQILQYCLKGERE